MIHTGIRRKITVAFCGLILSGAMLVSATAPAHAVSLTNAPTASASPSNPVIAKTVSNGATVLPAPPHGFSWKGPSMAMPSAGASMAEWKQWAAEQRSAIRAAPFAQQLAARGYRLITPVYYLPVGQVPGSPIPKGIITYAAAFTAAPIAKWTGATNQSSDPSTCGTIGGPGTACINATADGGGTAITATYQYEGSGSAYGHVELGVDGCPGEAAKNFPYNEILDPGDLQYVSYGPVYYSDEWSSTWWEYHGGSNYSDWGSVCQSY